MADVAAIILAAGLSRRMGSTNKLLIEVDGQTLLQRVVACCAAVSDHAVLVVTGYEESAIRASLDGFNVTFVHNPSYADGQMTSVDAGLRHAADAQTFLLALGDQPGLTPKSLRALLDAHHSEAGEKITVPMVDGTRGNPIVIPAAWRAKMLADPVNLGCRKLTRNAPHLVHSYPCDDIGFVADIDTPEDAVALLSRTDLEGTLQ